MDDHRLSADAAVTVRAYGELIDLVGSAEFEVCTNHPRSAKDLIESVGIPHCEVDLLLVDATPAKFDHLVVGGESGAVNATRFPGLDRTQKAIDALLDVKTR